MKKLILIFLILSMSYLTFSQECLKFPQNATIKSSATYVNDSEINNGKDTVLFTMSFFEFGKPIDCSNYKIQMTGTDYAGRKFTRKDVLSIEGTSMFQFWLPPAIGKPMVVVYQVSCISNNQAVRSSSVMINPRKR